jgi:hypothetical protein
MVCLRVLARTGRRAVGARALAFIPPQVILPCRFFASSGCAPKSVGTRKSPSYLARGLTTAGLQLAAVMMTRVRITQRCTWGSFCPHTGFVGSFLFISPRTGHGSSQVFEMLPAFSCISWARAFRAGGDASIFFSGPAEAEVGTSMAALADWLFWNIMAHPPLCEEDSTSPSHWL